MVNGSFTIFRTSAYRHMPGVPASKRPDIDFFVPARCGNLKSAMVGAADTEFRKRGGPSGKQKHRSPILTCSAQRDCFKAGTIP